jgi:hypothetical protein
LSNKNIVSLQFITGFINQTQISYNKPDTKNSNFYKNFGDKSDRKKRKSVIITDSILAYFYKTNDQVFLTRDIKQYGLYTGNIGTIISLKDNTNQISVSFELGQPLISVQFRNQLNKLVTMFVPFCPPPNKSLTK